MKKSAQKGFTLIELCVSAFLMVLISVAATVLIRNAVEASIEKRAVQKESQIGMSIMSRLRHDISSAQNMAIEDSGATLSMRDINGITINWVYRDAGGTLTDNTMIRIHNGADEDLVENQGQEVDYYVVCDDPCFTGFTQAGAASTDTPSGMRRVELNNFRVGHEGVNSMYSTEIDANHSGQSQFDTDEMVFRWSMGVQFE